MVEQWGSWILSAVGVTGFILAGRKVWWSWYVNFFCQFLWLAFAVLTEQWGFIVAALVYSVVFGKNAIAWTDEHISSSKIKKAVKETKLPDPSKYAEGDVIFFDNQGNLVDRYATPTPIAYSELTVRYGVDKLISDLDDARADGSIYTYGQIQERLRKLLTH